MSTNLKLYKAATLLLLLIALDAQIARVCAQGTAFTYQGRLNDGGNAANGNYDLVFTLYGTNSGGTAIAPPVTNLATAISNGLFSVTIDFGSGVFSGGTNWLQIAVETNGAGSFIALIPRQELTPAPYAIYAANAAMLANGAAIGSGVDNSISANGALDSFIGGGTSNNIQLNSFYSFIGGGIGNTNLSNAGYSVIGGGQNNQSASGWSVIGGGNANVIGIATVASTIGGGTQNTNYASYGTIAGGFQNIVSAGSATVSGGNFNSASGQLATIGGGFLNSASGYGAFVGGGGSDGFNYVGNVAHGNASVVGGGVFNIANGNEATVPGGYSNLANGTYSFAAGQQAQALYQGDFVWADSQNAPFASTASNQFNVRANNGVRFVTGGAGMTLDGQPVLAGSVAAGQLSGAYSNPVTFTNVADVFAGSFIGNGAGLTNVSAVTLAGMPSSNFWQLGGNNVAAGQFLGSTNNQPVELWASRARAFRLEPNTNGAPNVIGGSIENAVAAGVVGAFIGGGGATNFGGQVYSNFIGGSFSVIGGGESNRASAVNATVGGGYANVASGTGAFIGGGGTDGLNFLGNQASGPASVISGGFRNIASGDYTTIAGGTGNTATSQDATVGGGGSNSATNFEATVAGGAFNTAGGTHGTVGGGYDNTASAESATVSGGLGGVASGAYSTVPGGYTNIASGSYSFAAGQQAQALYAGDFVWADSQSAPFASSANDQFLVRAQGGVGINTASPNGALSVAGGVLRLNDNHIYLRQGSDTNHGLSWYSSGTFAGANPDGPVLFGCGGGALGTVCSGEAIALTWNQSGYVGIGNTGPTHLLQVGNAYCDGNMWVPSSDRALKAGFEPVDTEAILAKVAALPLTRWHYTNDAVTPHLGPMAQDFHAAFGLGADDRHIGDLDEGGVALAAIQGLNQRVNELAAELTRRDSENAELKRRLNALEEMMGRSRAATAGTTGE